MFFSHISTWICHRYNVSTPSAPHAPPHPLTKSNLFFLIASSVPLANSQEPLFLLKMDLSLSLLHAYICEATLSTKVETTCSLKRSGWEELEFFSSRAPSKNKCIHFFQYTSNHPGDSRVCFWKHPEFYMYIRVEMRRNEKLQLKERISHNEIQGL